MASPPFVHLNVHSGYSFHAGASTFEALVARAGVEGHGALALTDTDGAWALPLFQDACDAAGLRSLHGAEIHGIGTARGSEVERGERAVVLVKDEHGHRSLCRLLTRRHLDERFTLEDDLAAESRGLVVLTPSPRLLSALHDAFAPGDLHGEVVAWGRAADRAPLLETVRRLGRGVAGTFRVHLETPQRHPVHRLLLAIGHLKLLRDVVPGARGRDGRPLDLVPKAACLVPPEAAVRAFADVPGAAAATVAIAERLDFRFRRPERPRLPTLEHEEESAGPEPAPGADPAYGRLADLAMAGVRRRYGRLRPDVLARLEMELRVIQARGFCDYFLIVHDLVRFARERGIPVVGRGSAASSIVAYALGITSVDPLRHDLPFERFLSPARRDCPDIDLDIDWRGRDAVIEHAYDTYGRERVAMISTHVTFQARGAVREVAKTVGLPPPQVDRVVKHLPYHLARLPTRRLPPEARGLGLDRAPWRGVLRAAVALDGLPRHLSIHPGGIVIGDGPTAGRGRQPLADSLPLQRSAKGIVVTQYDMHGVEATGLVKIDLLGNRALAVVADVVRDVRQGEGDAVDLEGIPEEDRSAGDLLREGRTIGCFQVESPGMRNLVVRMQARSQDDAMIALSLIRPGPAGSGMKDAYVRRRRGEEEVPRVHPAVDPLFTHTHGVMLYQEDTLRVASAVAGFTLEQADLLRRALSKKREPEDLPRLEAEFRRQAAGRDIPPDVIETVWASIRRFSAYAYNKAHAATYGRISWQQLWLKARWPAEYLAAVLRNEGGFYAPRVYVEEARRLGCRIELPCVNRSETGPAGHRGVLRLGLGQVKGLREGTAASVVRLREAQGPYLSLTDLLLRVPVERHEAERLALAGALDVFDRPRGELLWILTLDFDRYVRAREERASRAALFGPTALLPRARTIAVPPTYTPEQLLEMESEALGLAASLHPSELLEEAAKAAGAVTTEDLVHHADEVVRVAGWIVTERRVRTRDREDDAGRRTGGRYMKFLMLEDLRGTVECVVFPPVYARIGHRFAGAGPWLLTGRVREDHGARTLEVLEVEVLPPAPTRSAERSPFAP